MTLSLLIKTPFLNQDFSQSYATILVLSADFL